MLRFYVTSGINDINNTTQGTFLFVFIFYGTYRIWTPLNKDPVPIYMGAVLYITQIEN